MIRIGNQTSFSAPPAEPFDYALANGFDAFEWFPDKRPDGAGWDETDLTSELRREICEEARAAGMRLSVHAPWQANPLEAQARALLERDVELARELGAALLNIHLYHEQGIEAFVQAILPLAREMGKAGLLLSIENTPAHAPEIFNELFAALKARDAAAARHVGMCLDLGHANLSAATRNRYLEFVDRLAPEVPIIHVHLHENWGDSDSHLPLFCGPAGQDDTGVRGFLERLKRRSFSGSIILEQWPQPPSLLNVARDRVRSLLGLELRQGRPSRRVEAEEPVPSRSLPEAVETDFASALAAADKRSRSWREKLDAVRGLLQSPTLSEPALALVAVYLRFLSAGQIPCVEDGRHFRPVHHARTAQEIRERLAALATPKTVFLLRRIEPWLPSSAAPFQRAEPLTRIRDIAHRNDIPQELKREIKDTLQNKLHRCAGPEDLITAEALLTRISAPGTGYSPDFVAQFKIFCAELREFFNASSLEERLRTLAGSAPSAEAALIQRYLETRNDSRAALTLLTELRRGLARTALVASGDDAQQRQLTDIGLEEAAFALSSTVINSLDATENDEAFAWKEAMSVLELLAINLKLGEVEPEECQAIESELRAWSMTFDVAHRDDLLRLKATVERCRRLAECFSQRLVRLFAVPALALGHALGIEERALRVFAEAEIRGHLVFQFSRLSDGLMRRLRRRLHLPPWDVLVGGRVRGRVRSARNLEAAQNAGSERMILLAERVAGDEEIPAAAAGLLIGHELPHLSHLAVRARQSGIVLAACEEPAAMETLKGLEGRLIELHAGAEGVLWQQIERVESGAKSKSRAPRPMQWSAAPDKPANLWLPLEQVTGPTGGEKAANAARLLKLAAEAQTGFKALPGLVIPFGVMEQAVTSVPDLARRWKLLLRELQESPEGDLGRRLEALRSMVLQIPVPEAIVSALPRQLGRGGSFMVRSSANCEDRADLAGAGLYESVANVSRDAMADAVRSVWASLWTHRAVMSRRQAGIPEEQARMAVLIQPMLDPDVSFILHTVHPVSGNTSQVYAELAPGLGETLASAAEAGTPWRLVCDKQGAAVTTLAFASFSRALHPGRDGIVERRQVAYSRQPLSCKPQAREQLGRRLARVGLLVENTFGGPQDIEGAVVGDQVWLVQSRPQQGVRKQA